MREIDLVDPGIQVPGAFQQVAVDGGSSHGLGDGYAWTGPAFMGVMPEPTPAEREAARLKAEAAAIVRERRQLGVHRRIGMGFVAGQGGQTRRWVGLVADGPRVSAGSTLAWWRRVRSRFSSSSRCIPTHTDTSIMILSPLPCDLPLAPPHVISSPM